jgi:hypothetical protein
MTIVRPHPTLSKGEGFKKRAQFKSFSFGEGFRMRRNEQ